MQQLAFFDEVDLVLVSDSGDAFLADLDVRGRTGAAVPDVVLMDIEMPGRDGIATTAEVKKTWPAMEVLILTVYEDEDKIFAAVQAGASGYLLKDAGPDAVVRAVGEIARGGAPTSPLVARKLLRYVRQQQGDARRSAAAAEALRLTPRETDVLSRLVEDDTEAGIAVGARREPAHGPDARQEPLRQAPGPQPRPGRPRRLRAGARLGFSPVCPGNGGVRAWSRTMCHRPTLSWLWRCGAGCLWWDARPRSLSSRQGGRSAVRQRRAPKPPLSRGERRPRRARPGPPCGPLPSCPAGLARVAGGLTWAAGRLNGSR